MNSKAERHLTQARKFVEKGEEFYRKAAEEIIAAQESDPALTWVEIGDRLERSEDWCRDTVSWYKIPANERVDRPTPYAGGAASRATRAARQVLREAPLERIEHLVAELPPDRQRAIAAAAGNEYLKARQDYDEEESRLTPAQRKGRQAATQAITEAGRRVTAGFLGLGIAGHLEQATEELHEIVADGSITATNLEPVTDALRAFVKEYEVACAMAGLESDLQVVGL